MYSNFKMLRHGIQFRGMYVESSMSAIAVSKALCGSSEEREVSNKHARLIFKNNFIVKII